MSQQELLKKVIQVLNQAGIQYMITGKTLRWKWKAIYRCPTGLWSTVWEVRYKLPGTVGKEIKHWIIMETVSGRSGNSIIDTRQLTACLRRFAVRSLPFCHSHLSLSSPRKWESIFFFCHCGTKWRDNPILYSIFSFLYLFLYYPLLITNYCICNFFLLFS